jgi:AraC-like DNA-binding protein
VDIAEQRVIIDPDAQPAAFGLAQDWPAFSTGQHAHRRAQLLYSTQGALRLSTEQLGTVLPPDRAAWIPGGAAHSVVGPRPVALRTVYFDPRPDDGEVVVFEAPLLLRELVVEICALGPTPPPQAQSLVDALRWLVDRWKQRPLPVTLPQARSPELACALEHLLQHLAHPVGLPDAARVAGLSPRSLQRRAQQELGTGLASWLQRARIQRAVELLAQPELEIGEIALRCGYQSPAAFTRAFSAITGVLPSAWRAGTRVS